MSLVRDGQAEVSEGGEALGEPGQEPPQAPQSAFSPLQHPDQELGHLAGGAVLPAAQSLSPQSSQHGQTSLLLSEHLE